MPTPTKTFASYFDKVQFGCGLQNVSFPIIATLADWQNQNNTLKRVKWGLDQTLRYLNNRYWLAFQETFYNFYTVSGQYDYDLSIPPFSQVFWRMNRTGRNGVIRLADDFVLPFVDYTYLDRFRLDISLPSRPLYYSGFGNFLRLGPKPSGEELKVRYYPTAIATDSTGINLQNELILATDLPTLNDEWEDCLVTGAVFRLRLTDRSDAKTAVFQKQWEDWETLIAEVTTKQGEEAITQFKVMTSGDMNYLMERTFPFFTNLP